MLLVYNYVFLKMSTWYSKHVEESNNILRINNIQCITLVIFYGQFMMHGQRNIELKELLYVWQRNYPKTVYNKQTLPGFLFFFFSFFLNTWFLVKPNDKPIQKNISGRFLNHGVHSKSNDAPLRCGYLTPWKAKGEWVCMCHMLRH